MWPSTRSGPRRAVSLVLVCLLTLLVAGCSGTTEPATQIGETSARLNGQGTMDNGPGRVFFELRPADSFSAFTRVSETHLPGGASGRFSAQVDGLCFVTTYEFRLCGIDDAAPSRTICAQTRRFTTATPDGDRVRATLFNSRPLVAVWQVDASSGPSGQDANGGVRLGFADGEFRGFVTCLDMRGDGAVVGAVGEGRTSDGRVYRSAVTSIGPDRSANIGIVFRESADRPDCETEPHDASMSANAGGSINLYDAP